MALYSCPECGKQVSSQANKCPHCGYPMQSVEEMQNDKIYTNQPVENSQDIPSIGLNILSFLIPIVGLILFCVNISAKPKKAKSIGIWALIGFVLGLIVVSL